MIRHILKSYSISMQHASTRTLEKLFNHSLFHNLSSKHSAMFTHTLRSNSGQKQEDVTVANIIRHWHEKFKKEGISEPIESIQFIIAHVLGIRKVTDLANQQERKVTEEQLLKLESLCECRLSRMPVQYIIGEWDFRDITLKLEPPVFIPRAETELLVDIVLQKLTSRHEICKVLEIGCGSGAICLSLLHSKRDLSVVAIDTNSQACELTLRNAKDLGYHDRLVILGASLKEDGVIYVHKEYHAKRPIKFNEDRFDFIVSNPPYIPTKRIFTLQPEVRVFEDIRALDGGKDGLDLIEAILKYSSKALNVGGLLILEVDSSHPDRVQSLIEESYKNELKFVRVIKDYCDKDRIIEISKIQ